MIACALFTIAGLIAFQNCSSELNSDGEPVTTNGDLLFFMAAWICWVVAAFCGFGVISQS